MMISPFRQVSIPLQHSLPDFITQNGWVGKCQDSWHPQLIYAACFSRSGFSIASPIACQFLVLPDQRSGSCAFAIWYTSSSFFSTVPSSPRCRWPAVTYLIQLFRCVSLYQCIKISNRISSLEGRRKAVCPFSTMFAPLLWKRFST